ncbi:MAG TPA: hypothetical protein VLH94_03050 [Spirochaetia bacterium]|nr:hypothetical protein [Spirochaetia bacterium]
MRSPSRGYTPRDDGVRLLHEYVLSDEGRFGTISYAGDIWSK